MLEATLAQLESLVAELLQQNQALNDHCRQLEGQLRQAREENENLQMTALEQEEQQTATLARLQALVQRAGVSSSAA